MMLPNLISQDTGISQGVYAPGITYNLIMIHST
jgi:hypothetical protein